MVSSPQPFYLKDPIERSPSVNFKMPDDDYSKDTRVVYDDFIVGDRVWVDGNKPGYIQYIGDVHFAEGDWAGVVLDEPIGRNAGSVSGRRYFYCEPKRGLFCRTYRLSRYPIDGKYTPDSGISSPIRRLRNLSLSGERLSSTSPSRLSPSRLSPSRSSTRISEYRSRSKVSGYRDFSPIRFRSLSPDRWDDDLDDYCKVHSYTLPRRPAKTITHISTKTTTIDGPYRPGPLRLGDKVFVNSNNGVLTGRLRYLGLTHFAPGQWAGVELDEPHGKNNGEVAGKKYFSCRNRYGLFSPTYKVVKADPNRMTTVTTVKRNIPRGGPHF